KTRLLKLMGPGVPEAPRWYVRLPGETVRIDGGMSGIHYCNAHAPLTVTDDTIYAYTRFYYYFASGARVFEGRIKRSSVGYTGKIWFYEKKSFFESDVNITAKGLVTELERVPVPDVPDF